MKTIHKTRLNHTLQTATWVILPRLWDVKLGK